jgi:FkbM family methyltransferase
MVVDVGANEGQFAANLRTIGYRGRIYSFEPSALAHARLIDAASGDAAWKIGPRVACGSEAVAGYLNVSNNSVSSSILHMTTLHEDAAPGSSVGRMEEIEIVPLDCVMTEESVKEAAILLKIDTQGYELEVLRGAPRTLGRTNVVLVELSCVELYRAQPLFYEICAFLCERGFRLADIVPGLRDRTSGDILQFDGEFVRDVSERKPE